MEPSGKGSRSCARVKAAASSRRFSRGKFLRTRGRGGYLPPVRKQVVDQEQLLFPIGHGAEDLRQGDAGGIVSGRQADFFVQCREQQSDAHKGVSSFSVQ